MQFSAASRKHKARDCLNFCPKCTKTRLRAHVISNNFKGERRKCKREGGIRMNRRKGMGRKDEGGGRRRGEGG
jgi:hypothetical protein